MKERPELKIAQIFFQGSLLLIILPIASGLLTSGLLTTGLIKKLNFNKLKRISDYKAIYIEDAKDSDIKKINMELACIEPKFGGYGFIQPSATFHRFMTGLTGDKMSSSKPESAIFLSDSPEEAKYKIMHAKTGGAISLEEQRKKGGKPDECVVYELFLYHLIEDDKDLKNIYQKCKNGEQICGNCKKYATQMIGDMLTDLEEKRNDSKDKIKLYL
jgi:tryptophanyl-tRNA synthetase